MLVHGPAVDQNPGELSGLYRRLRLRRGRHLEHLAVQLLQKPSPLTGVTWSHGLVQGGGSCPEGIENSICSGDTPRDSSSVSDVFPPVIFTTPNTS